MVLVMNIPVATPIVVPVAMPIENVAIAVSTGCRCRRLIVSSIKLFGSVAALFCDATRGP